MSLQPGRWLVREMRREKNSTLGTLVPALKTYAQNLVGSLGHNAAAAALNVTPAVLTRYLGATPRKGDIATVQMMVRAYSKRYADVQRTLAGVTCTSTATRT